jgi:hypothetical protein
MNILTNEKAIRRNTKIGKFTSVLALGLMSIGLYFSFQFTDEQFAIQNESYIWWMSATLFAGFVMFQIGIYFMNRFGGQPDQSPEQGTRRRCPRPQRRAGLYRSPGRDRG